MNIRYLAFAFAICAIQANADSSTKDAAIGGGIGGAAGAAVGNEIGGRDGAILGGALGAAVGAAIGTEGKKSDPIKLPSLPVSDANHSHGHFCPPGQAKKGRC